VIGLPTLAEMLAASPAKEAAVSDVSQSLASYASHLPIIFPVGPPTFDAKKDARAEEAARAEAARAEGARAAVASPDGTAQ